MKKIDDQKEKIIMGMRRGTTVSLSGRYVVWGRLEGLVCECMDMTKIVN